MEFWTGATGLFRMRATPANLLDGYADYVAGAKQAEKLGFDAYGAPEHHFMYDGFIPVPLVALAAAAGATTKIKFITGAMLLPLYDPIEAAELVATLDVISGGRAMLGLGMAYRPYEFDGVGTAKRTRGARLSEGIDLLNALTAGGDVDFAGTPTPRSRRSASWRRNTSGPGRKPAMTARPCASRPSRTCAWASRSRKRTFSAMP